MGGSGSGNRTPSIRPARVRRLRADGTTTYDSGPPPPDADQEADEQDLLKLARRDFKKYGAVTREDRIALASRFVRNSDPMIALQYSKLLEQMERGADSAETGLPPPTTTEEQAQRLSRLMCMVDKDAADQAYELFLVDWRERETQTAGRFRSSLPAEPGDAIGRGVDETEPANGLAECVSIKSRDASVGAVAAVAAAGDERGVDAGHDASVSELHRATEDHSPTAGAQPEIAAGNGSAAAEAGDAAEVLRPTVAPVRVPWNPNYDGVKYSEYDDGDPE